MSASYAELFVFLVIVAVAVSALAGTLFGLYFVGKTVGRTMIFVTRVTDGIGRLIVGTPTRQRRADSGLPPAPPPPVRRYLTGGWWGSGRASASSLRCPRPRCHAENVPSAKFCRRCGSAMDDRSAVAARGSTARRAAMW